MRHRQTKEPATDRRLLNHRATSRQFAPDFCDCYTEGAARSLCGCHDLTPAKESGLTLWIRKPDMQLNTML